LVGLRQKKDEESRGRKNGRGRGDEGIEGEEEEERWKGWKGGRRKESQKATEKATVSRGGGHQNDAKAFTLSPPHPSVHLGRSCVALGSAACLGLIPFSFFAVGYPSSSIYHIGPILILILFHISFTLIILKNGKSQNSMKIPIIRQKEKL
jgi:hypothetical protein